MLQLTKKNDEEQVELASDSIGDNHYQVGITDGEAFFIFIKNMKICDTAASCHITNNNDGMCNVKEINETVWEV